MAEFLSRIKEMLETIPNNDELKELVEFGEKWGTCFANEAKDIATEGKEEAARLKHSPEAAVIVHLWDLAYSMKQGAKIFSSMTPNFLEMAKVFATVTPTLVQSA